jgi:type II secretory pathway component PulL
MPNFMASQLTQKQLKKELYFAGGLLTLLLVLIFVMWGAGAYLEMRTLKQKQSQLTQAIEAVFTDNVPEVTKIVQPVAQMENHLAQYQNESAFLMQAVKTKALPLRVLQHVSEQVTEESKISITFIEIDSAKVSLEGTAPSYESVESLAEDFRRVPEYMNVQLGDVSGAKTGSQVSFELSISRGIDS